VQPSRRGYLSRERARQSTALGEKIMTTAAARVRFVSRVLASLGSPAARALARCLGVAVLGASAASGQWPPGWNLLAAGVPPPVRYHAMVFDLARSVCVTFGGWNGAGGTAETWEWNGTSWTQRLPAAAPWPRWGHAMAYDGVRGRTVLFGGIGSGNFGDTWEYDGAAVTWTPRATGGGPPARRVAAMAFDTLHGVCVLFGGQNDTLSFSDTWTWDGVAWTQRAVAGPAAREQHSMAYDSHRGVVVLFGGFDMFAPPPNSFGDTWEWDGAAWTQRATSGPLAAGAHAMAYDSVRQRTVLVMGHRTWVWDGTAWAEAPTPGLPSRDSAAMAFDAAREQVVRQGGYDTISSTLTRARGRCSAARR
jgi:hypothetical protein